jgi:omega-6 fatty acid desaturase (delta-12 desaturase)
MEEFALRTNRPGLRPRDVDARVAASGLTLAALRCAIPRGLYALRPARAWAALARSWAVVAIGEAWLWSTPLHADAGLVWRLPSAVLASVVVAAGMSALFVIGHDCGHRSFARSPWVNDAVGHLCMAPLLTSFHAWRIGHNHHHAYTQLRGVDTDWPERMLTPSEYRAASRGQRLAARLAFASPAGLAVGFAVGTVRRALMPWLYPQVALSAGARRAIAFSNLVAIAVGGGLVACLLRVSGWPGVLKYYALPLSIMGVAGAFATYLHHSAAGAIVFEASAWSALRGQLVSTFDVRFPAWCEALFLNINRHPAHHVSPRVPFYHLPEASRALAAAFPDLWQKRWFAWSDLRSSWRVPLLRRTADGVFEASEALPAVACFRAVGFSEDDGT